MLHAGEVLSMTFPLWVGTTCCVALSFLWVDKNLEIFGPTLTLLGLFLSLGIRPITND
ncbi:hypothetical protein ZIOFF_031363 [Zingiber officinale]|uniref:Uncharacterized protein n=1 Tax=Zingiber officinale TaxID=94328 RepID=A0A8J5L4V0_ZINOF|nr:hypothetical protein ZIOFF_031363 [Zingiber officinale]